jgi:UDP-3-O-[3-hydroxymyristoyl] glucosamine N-acyltransferase LpxD
MQSMSERQGSKRLSTKQSWDIRSIFENSRTDYDLEGDKSKKIKSVASIEEASSDDLAFCSSDGERAHQMVSNSKAGILLCHRSLKGSAHSRNGSLLVFVDNPRLTFVHFVNSVLKKEKQEIGMSGYVAKNAVISEDAKIGKNCTIGNFVVIGKNCIIGDNTEIHDRVTLAQNCRIGSNCIIQSGVTMGEDGFAYERHPSSELEKFPHFGGVVIGNDVEIDANCSIARGSLSDTIIGDGTKLDALVHLAHNVKIGKICQLASGTIIGGSAKLGDSCWTGLNSTIKNKITIGNNVLVGAGACVIKDVPDGDVVAGVPAKSIKSKVTSNETFQMAGQQHEK